MNALNAMAASFISSCEITIKFLRSFFKSDPSEVKIFNEAI